MKKLAYSLLFVMIVTLSIFLFVSCGEDKNDAELAQVTVKFMIGDKVYSESLYKEGQEVEKPDVTEYGSYVITGWTINGSNKYAFFPYEVGKTDITFIATTTHAITVSFYAEGENVLTKKYENNGMVQSVEAPAIDGYKFMGWQLDDNCVSFPYSLKKCKDDSIRFDAIYEKLYKAEFISFGETYSKTYYTKDSSLFIPENPVVEGYSFICWEDSDGNRIENDIIMNQDVQYTARFEKDLYQVNYYIGSSTTPYKTLYTSLKAIDLKYEGEGEFYGWYTGSKFTTKFDFTKLINRNVNIYGKVYTDDYSILRSYGNSQKTDIDTSTFNASVFNTTYPTSVTIAVNSNTVRATYSFTSSDRKKGTIVYDLFEGAIYATYGADVASISIGVEEYNYNEIDLSHYRYSQSKVNQDLNPELKKISLKVAETVYEYIHGIYTSAKTGSVSGGEDFPEITFNVNAQVYGNSIKVTSDTTFYSLKVYSSNEGVYVNYYENGKDLLISNLESGNYILTFAFEKTVDNFRIRQYYNINVSI